MQDLFMSFYGGVIVMVGIGITVSFIYACSVAYDKVEEFLL